MFLIECSYGIISFESFINPYLPEIIKIINAQDKTALKTHYPYYPGIEEMVKGHSNSNSIITKDDESDMDENRED